MNRTYVLAQEMKYRREWFGGLVYSGLSKTTSFFNHAAAYAIEQFRSPTPLASAQRAVEQLIHGWCDWAAFYAGLEDTGVIAPVTDPGAQPGRLWKPAFLFSRVG